MYYTAIPFGTAIGYGYGAGVAASSVGWPGAFYLEALLVAPFALYCFVIPLDAHKPPGTRTSIGDDGSSADPLVDDSMTRSILHDNQEPGAGLHARRSFNTARDEERASSVNGSVNSHGVGDGAEDTPSIWSEVRLCLSRPLFVWNALGYAGYSGGLIGFSTFGPAFAMGLGYFNTEYMASITFGGVIAVAGLVGTPIGGVILDRGLDEANVDADHVGRQPAEVASRYSCLINLVGTLIVSGVVLVKPKLLFIGLLGVGATFLFVSTAAMNLACMESVPPANRSFAMGFATMLMHAFGDVPSPVIIGALKDYMAPDCVPHVSDDDDLPVISDECADERGKLRLVLLFIIAWLATSSVAYAVAWLLARRRRTYGRRDSESLIK